MILLVGSLNLLFEHRRGVELHSAFERINNQCFCFQGNPEIFDLRRKKVWKNQKMGDSSSVSGTTDSQSFLGGHWDGFKGFWVERLSFLENYTRFTKRDTPLPSWSSSDVDEFIASDPVHGPTVYLPPSLPLVDFVV